MRGLDQKMEGTSLTGEIGGYPQWHAQLKQTQQESVDVRRDTRICGMESLTKPPDRIINQSMRVLLDDLRKRSLRRMRK